MNREELQNYAAEEKERSERALRKCASLNFFNPRFFFEDKVHLKESYAVRMSMEIPVKLLLPFYEQVFVLIRPFKSPEEFEKRCGITAKEMEILFAENRVIPLPIGRLDLYEGLDYMNPILEKKPPTMKRIDYVELYLEGLGAAGKRVRYVLESNAELAGRFKNLAEKYKEMSYFKELPRTVEEQLEIESLERYQRLSCFGYNWLARAIARMDDVASVYYQLSLCDAFLTNPFIIGGCSQVTTFEFDFFRGQEFLVKGERTRIFEKSLKNMEPFPIEIARVLVTQEEKRLRLLFPSEIALSDILTIAGDSALRKAREALGEFNIAVQKELAKDKILDKRAAIYAVWDQAREAIEEMKMVASFDKWYQWCLSMGIIGTLAISLTGFPGLLSLLGAGVALDKIIKPQAPMAGFGSLPIALYKLEQVFEKTRNKVIK